MAGYYGLTYLNFIYFIKELDWVMREFRDFISLDICYLRFCYLRFCFMVFYLCLWKYFVVYLGVICYYQKCQLLKVVAKVTQLFNNNLIIKFED